MHSLRHILGHQGLHLILFAGLISFLTVNMVPESFMRLDNQQKKELLKNRIRRLRRKSEELFDLEDDERNCN